MLKPVLAMSMCLESSDQYQEKLKLDLGNTLLDRGINRFDLGKMDFSHLGKTFVFWHLTLRKSDLGKGSRNLENGHARCGNGRAPWEIWGKFPSLPTFSGFPKVLSGGCVQPSETDKLRAQDTCCNFIETNESNVRISKS